MLVTIAHDPNCPRGENGLRAYHEAREALSTMPPEARATDEDRIALAIAEAELEAKQKCNCGADRYHIIKISQSCSWCDELNELTGAPSYCRKCGHRADVCRMQCDCSKCRRILLTPHGGSRFV